MFICSQILNFLRQLIETFLSVTNSVFSLSIWKEISGRQTVNFRRFFTKGWFAHPHWIPPGCLYVLQVFFPPNCLSKHLNHLYTGTGNREIFTSVFLLKFSQVFYSWNFHNGLKCENKMKKINLMIFIIRKSFPHLETNWREILKWCFRKHLMRWKFPGLQ
jgi:hypothetical protein